MKYKLFQKGWPCTRITRQVPPDQLCGWTEERQKKRQSEFHLLNHKSRNLALMYYFETIKSKKLQLALMTLASFYTLALQTKEMFWQPNVCDTKKPFQAVSHQQKLPTWQQGLLPATALSLLLTISARSALWEQLPSRALALGTCYYSCSCRGASRSGLSISAFGVDSWGTTYMLERLFAWVH